MRLSTQVLIGLVLGIGIGLFFGEMATALDVVGNAFIRLLQMSVIPYVALSLMAGVGRLDTGVAKQLALRGGAWLLVLWATALGAVVLFPIAFPDYQTASFFSTALVAEPEQIDLLALYIPSNPIYSMVHNLMPAIVLFSLVVGVALLTLPGRGTLVAQLSVFADALMRVSEWVVRLAPFGVCALMASAAGTLTLAELERLQVFVLTFAALASFLALWVLPGLVAAVTPLQYRHVLQTSREALVTAFATASLLVVLPILAAESRKLAASASDPDADEDAAVAEIIVPVAYNFPSVGKLLVLSFILFGGWFSGSELSLTDLPALLGIGTFTFFGPNVMAIPFMLDVFHLPSDLFPVFMAVDVLTGRFFVLAAAMHILTLALLVTFSLDGRLDVRPAAIGRWAFLSIAGACALLFGLRFYYDHALDLESKTYELFVDMQLAGETVAVVADPPLRTGASSVLQQIRSTRVLSVCYPSDALPFAFVNAHSTLVGFDVDVAHALATSLQAGLHLHHVEREDIPAALDRGTCDIGVGGIALTPQRVEQMSFSTPYLDNTLAFVVRDHDRHDWATWDEIREMPAPKIGVPDVPHYLRLLGDLVPEAELVRIASPRPYFRDQVAPPLDALAMGAEPAGAWTLVYPGYAVAVPQPDPIGIPLAYAVRRGEWEWAAYVSAWVELKKRDHTLKRLYGHWILGQATRDKTPRWSVIRDVLGWVE